MIVCVALVITGVLNIKQALLVLSTLTSSFLFVAMFIVGGALCRDRYGKQSGRRHQ